MILEQGTALPALEPGFNLKLPARFGGTSRGRSLPQEANDKSNFVRHRATELVANIARHVGVVIPAGSCGISVKWAGKIGALLAGQMGQALGQDRGKSLNINVS